MARVVYQTPVRVGGTTVQVQRTENMCEDWNWRTVKLIGFIIGSFAVFLWVFQFGSWFGGRAVASTPTPTPGPPVGIVGTVVPSPPPVPAPSTVGTVIKAEPIKVEVVIRPSLPALPPPTGGSSPPTKKSGLPPRAW